MPLTPFHFGPGLLIAVIFLRRLDLITVLIASVIVDIEPFIVLLFGLNYPLHGFFHSFLGGSLVAIVLAGFIYHVYRYFEKKVLLRKIVISSFAGVHLHILLDSFLYLDIKPFYLSGINPFYGLVSSSQVYMFCVVSFIIGSVAIIYLKSK